MHGAILFTGIGWIVLGIIMWLMGVFGGDQHTLTQGMVLAVGGTILLNQKGEG